MPHPHDVHLDPAHEDPHLAASEILQQEAWLIDKHIDPAQYLLGNSFPFISGFQSTIVFDSKDCVHVKTPGTSFVQILNVHSNHWITVSNIQCKDNTIKIYDSLNSSRLEASVKFSCQVAALLNCQSSGIRVENVNILQQKGSSDCGLFAITCATSLCFGFPPEAQNFVQGKMRSHLAKCFQEGMMLPFPVAPPLLVPQSSKIFEIGLCCKCRKPCLIDSSLIECMLCNSRYHFHCGMDNNDDISIDLFVCGACKSEI